MDASIKSKKNEIFFDLLFFFINQFDCNHVISKNINIGYLSCITFSPCVDNSIFGCGKRSYFNFYSINKSIFVIRMLLLNFKMPFFKLIVGLMQYALHVISNFIFFLPSLSSFII